MNPLRSRTLLFLGLMPVMALAAHPPPLHQFSLDNGLKVLVQEDHRAPLVTSQLWLKVGSSDEAPGQSGLSHALEHMLYKGSAKLCDGEATAILQRLGAEHNALTGTDGTAYFQTLSSRYLDVTFELMADLMSTALLQPDALSTEMEVVRAERRIRTDDNPEGLALERHQSLAFPASSYRTPTIGWMHDLQRITADNVRDWYENRYAPGNATLIVAGDVKLDQVKSLAQQYFGPLASRPFPQALKPLELATPGERRQVLALPIHAPLLLMSFNVPGAGTVDPQTVHALRLLDMLLAGSNSARVRKRLMFNEQIFSDVISDYDHLARGDTLVSLKAQLSSSTSVSLEEAQARLWKVFDELRNAPVPDNELERARTQLIARQIYAQDSLFQQGYRLANREISGLPAQSLEQEHAELKQVSAEDIQNAAKTYLTRDRLSVTHVTVEKPHE